MVSPRITRAARKLGPRGAIARIAIGHPAHLAERALTAEHEANTTPTVL
jgi:hypothetical protein